MKRFSAVMLVLATAVLLAGCREAARTPPAEPAPAKPVAAAPALEPVAVTPAPAAPVPAALVAPPAPPQGPAGPFALDAGGYVRNWLVLGPFPNEGKRPETKGLVMDYLEAAGGEAKIVPASGGQVAAPDGRTLLWQTYASPRPEVDFCVVPHLGLQTDQPSIVAYAACWLQTDADADVDFRVGSDDGYKIWVDHEQVATKQVYRAAKPDQEVYPVKLTAGRHLVLVKVETDIGGFVFMMRVLKTGESAPADVRVGN